MTIIKKRDTYRVYIQYRGAIVIFDDPDRLAAIQGALNILKIRLSKG